jgi:phosphoglycerol transferase MdoB-like AlkP superfamily enzyme
MEFPEIFQQLSIELLLWALVVGVLVVYVLYYGVKEIVFLAAAGYIARAILPILPFSTSSLGDFSADSVLFLAALLVIFLLLGQSSVGQAVRITKKPYWVSFLFVLVAAGFLLSNIWFYNQGTLPGEIPFITPSLFKGQLAQIIWLLAPLVVFFFLQANKRS